MILLHCLLELGTSAYVVFAFLGERVEMLVTVVNVNLRELTTYPYAIVAGVCNLLLHVTFEQSSQSWLCVLVL